MISVYLQGGLGNQIFQLFTAIAYSLRYNVKLEIPSYKWDAENRPTYWGTLFKKLNDFKYINDKLQPGSLPRHCEDGFHYTEIPKKDNFILYGYFQSYKYFEKEYDAIMKKFGIKLLQQVIRGRHLRLRESISLHFRIGDYKEFQFQWLIMANQYYVNALAYIMEKTGRTDWDVIYYCEEKDNVEVEQRIRYIRSKLPTLKFHKASDEMEDWEQMLLMSASTHNIISNSSFSWWGAYFNSNKDKIVCYPDKWFGVRKRSNDTKDLCPASWVKITDKKNI
tara:strand:- start:16164 stop:17000 length:837 start_codon:yes stop_codon:yes gene_type:complete